MTLSKEEAIALSKSEFWKEMSFEDIVKFQLIAEPLLCMPFPVFQEAIEKCLGRPVFTHEFAYKDSLIKEFLGDKPAPTPEEIMNLIPKDKRILLVVR